jgi:hypothetical protein
MWHRIINNTPSWWNKIFWVLMTTHHQTNEHGRFARVAHGGTHHVVVDGGSLRLTFFSAFGASWYK